MAKENMNKLSLKEVAFKMNEILFLTCFPVAISFSEEEKLPPKARRPIDSVGYPLAICQGINMARNLGWTIGFLKEDHCCPPSFIILGLQAEPEDYPLSEALYPRYCETPDICASNNKNLATLPLGKYKSIVVAPLAKATYEPDLILVYGNPAQISRLIHSALYLNDESIKSTFLGRNSCAPALVDPFLSGHCKVIVPGSGERVFASTQDHEMCFAIPGTRLNEVIYGLDKTHAQGTMRYPTPFHGMRLEPKFPEKLQGIKRF